MSRARQLMPLMRLVGSAQPVVVGELATLLRQPSLLAATEAAGLAVLLRAAVAPTAAAAPAALPFAARGVATTAQAAQAAAKDQKQQPGDAREEELVAADERFSAITDKIPQRPVSVVEGTSYTLVIIAALGFAAAVVYAALNELIFSPKEYQCYAATLDRIKDDPRVTVRLGSPLSAYGTESRNRAQRQRIPHRIYSDPEGREHVQLQFHAKGPAGRATVNADMYKDGPNWRYHFLYLNVEAPIPQQVVLVRPGQVDEY